MNIDRRKFIKGMAAATAAMPFTSTFASVLTDVPEINYPIAFFTKPLDSFEISFRAETLA
jgi:hypothetical protein